MSTTPVTIDPTDLAAKVQAMYRDVAQDPRGQFHFEMGRALAERLGYPPAALDRVPSEATDSFAGVGYHLDLADLKEGETVVDFGSGSGMDTFVAALIVGPSGKVIGVDMTEEQLAKSERLRTAGGFDQVTYLKSDIASVPLSAGFADVVISNGVMNLAPDKDAVFWEIARLLKPGGRLAISDIVTKTDLPDTVVGDSNLWAACIGGAMRDDTYGNAIEAAGLDVRTVRENPRYRFLSEGAKQAQATWGVRSISLLALKP